MYLKIASGCRTIGLRPATSTSRRYVTVARLLSDYDGVSWRGRQSTLPYTHTRAVPSQSPALTTVA